MPARPILQSAAPEVFEFYERPILRHILVGLGGTGGAVLKEFRKEMFRRHGVEMPDGIRVEYLYVDSSPSDLDNESDWKVLGQSVQLPPFSRMSIHAPDLAAIVENASAFPGIASWLGPCGPWAERASWHRQGYGAGQLRRLGRLLFALNVTKFNSAIKEKYNSILSGAQQGDPYNTRVTFHIICGLAGGTSSGSVLDASVQIGKFLAEQRGRQDQILIYAYLPERSPLGQTALKYYLANGSGVSNMWPSFGMNMTVCSIVKVPSGPTTRFSTLKETATSILLYLLHQYSIHDEHTP